MCVCLAQGSSQREAQAAREAQQQLALARSEVRRLEGELDTARRERDALQLEMSLVQVSRRGLPNSRFQVVGRRLEAQGSLGGHGGRPHFRHPGVCSTVSICLMLL